MLGFLTGLLGKLFGSAVESTAKAAGGAVDAAGQALVAATKDPGDVASARQFGAPGAGTGWFRSFADGINCLIRPGITIWLLLIVGGAVPAPAIEQLNPVYVEWFEKIMIFFFGARAAVYDLPRMIAGVKQALRF